MDSNLYLGKRTHIGAQAPTLGLLSDKVHLYLSEGATALRRAYMQQSQMQPNTSMDTLTEK
jgi:hypothetical protein